MNRTVGETVGDSGNMGKPRTGVPNWGIRIAITNGVVQVLLFPLLVIAMLYLIYVFPWVALLGTIVSVREVRNKVPWSIVALVLNLVAFLLTVGFALSNYLTNAGLSR